MRLAILLIRASVLDFLKKCFHPIKQHSLQQHSVKDAQDLVMKVPRLVKSVSQHIGIKGPKFVTDHKLLQCRAEAAVDKACAREMQAFHKWRRQRESLAMEVHMYCGTSYEVIIISQQARTKLLSYSLHQSCES